MRAAVFLDGGFTLADLPEPVPGPGQVLVRPLVCGICGSDLHTRHHAAHLGAMLTRAGFRGFMDPARPVVMGHEFTCEVIDYGPGTRRTIDRGGRVVGLPFVATQGGAALLGYSNDLNGAFAQLMVIDEAAMFAVPDAVSTDVAALAEPLAVAVHAINVAAVDVGCAIAVYGCGPVGLFIIARLKRLRLGPVLAIDPDAHRRGFAEIMGADAVITPDPDAVARWWNTQGVPIGVSDAGIARASGIAARRPVVFECVGKPGMIAAIAEQAPVGATVTVVGVCMESDRFEPGLLVQKQLNLRFVFAYQPDEFAEAVAMIAAGPDTLAPLVTGHVALADITTAFDRLERGGKDAKVHIVIE